MPTKETLGPTDSQWLGQYSQVHMNVFGTPLRCLLYTSDAADEL